MDKLVRWDGWCKIITNAEVSANVADIAGNYNRIWEEDDVVYTNRYHGIQKHLEIKNDEYLGNVDHRVIKRLGRKKAQPQYDGVN